MLKLVHALDVNFNSVVDYDKSYLETSGYSCYAVVTSRGGKEKYFEYVKLYNKNMYYMVDDANPDYIIGYINISHLTSHRECLDEGNISYDIRPCERHKGYGTTILSLILNKCKEI